MCLEGGGVVLLLCVRGSFLGLAFSPTDVARLGNARQPGRVGDTSKGLPSTMFHSLRMFSLVRLCFAIVEGTRTRGCNATSTRSGFWRARDYPNKHRDSSLSMLRKTCPYINNA
ncbi:hypothetical protein B0H21DRAFT_159019 [Amylocystis lapponica]|nr:hypothetical protein B0H21DRAFT_159019 [Amylocystis lapponica]